MLNLLLDDVHSFYVNWQGCMGYITPKNEGNVGSHGSWFSFKTAQAGFATNVAGAAFQRLEPQGGINETERAWWEIAAIGDVLQALVFS